ncbi:tail fiber domain-containing protein [Coraliomargarita sp. SDUM461004]|uniref:Tail fiber domain-containing protein n=1 Tax=Thalassobacterium sedimentorum TaxID=3041258 RepID=A0ABU1ALY9_9BACT|nr:tail fiber domain-containing protein [Coraliomargarita sp. SDUM461004]MDQ8195822.1 tail fiber domain-containing protein [Coraliomargarita sp. SDUM461004]
MKANSSYLSTCLLCALTLAISTIHAAEPPRVLNQQGRIAVSGENFTGTGYFKFVLIGPGPTTLWSHDGSGFNGAEPYGSLQIPVANGHYAVGLGDATMTAIPATLFPENSEVSLRIWFSTSNGGPFEQLTPDRTISAAAYALSAAVSTGLQLPATSDHETGVVTQDGMPFLHSFGPYNLFLGQNAGNFTLGVPSDGDANTGIGYQALKALTVGDNNVALGTFTLNNNTSGTGNTAVGKEAMSLNVDGSYNSAFGLAAGISNVSGNQNVALGYSALLISKGSHNTAIGSFAGRDLTDGDHNIMLGSDVWGVIGESNTTRIGANQNRTFIDGIHGVSPAGSSLMPVVIDSDGQLGTGVSGAPLMLGTSGNAALEFKPNNTLALRLLPGLSDGSGVANILGGYSGNSINTAAQGATISGGGLSGEANAITSNLASYAVIAGGRNNTASNVQAVIGGGSGNVASAASSTVAGGRSNTASGEASTVSGGASNTASGENATVPGGVFNDAIGQNSFAVGGNAKAIHDGTFVWADTEGEPTVGAPFASTGRDQFLIRATNGVGIGTNTPQADLEVAGTIRATSLEGDGVHPLLLSTETSQPMEIEVNGLRAFKIQPGDASNDYVNNMTSGVGTASLIGGYAENVITPGLDGATISGGGGYINFGGYASLPNAIIGTGDYGTIGGGYANEVSGAAATIGGGRSNQAAGLLATVPGGEYNRADGKYSFASGRYAQALHDGTFVWADSTNTSLPFFNSTAINQFLISATGGVGIGTNDPQAALDVNGIIRATGFESVGAPLVLSTSDDQAVEIQANGQRAVRYEYTTATNAPNILGGHSENTIGSNSASSIIAGGGQSSNPNEIGTNSAFATVSGGIDNTITNSLAATIAGGATNSVSGLYGTIGGGYNNQSKQFSTVAGGYLNNAFGNYSSIVGGSSNTASGNSSTVGGGFGNEAAGTYSSIPGGNGNETSVDASYAFAAGRQAKANHPGTFVWADSANDAASADDFVSTGIDQFLIRATGGVGIGTNNPLADLHIISTEENPKIILQSGFDYGQMGYLEGAGGPFVISAHSVINATDLKLRTDGKVLINSVDGLEPILKLQSDGTNEISGRVSMRQSNDSGFDMYYDGTADVEGLVFEAFGAGFSNGKSMFMDLTSGTVGIGTINPDSNHRLVIENEASDDVLRLIGPDGLEGYGARLNFGNADYVYIEEPFDDGLQIQASVVGIGGIPGSASSGGAKLQVLGNISATGTITPSSDRNLKKNFEPIDHAAILEKVVALPLQRWTYKAETDEVRHLGPMAQDFSAAFGLGLNDVTIATVDADGVALAAIQGLNAKLERNHASKENRIAELERENSELRERMQQLENMVHSLAAAANNSNTL